MNWLNVGVKVLSECAGCDGGVTVLSGCAGCDGGVTVVSGCAACDGGVTQQLSQDAPFLPHFQSLGQLEV